MDDLLFKRFLGDTWTYLDSTGFPVTITWEEKIRRLGERKDMDIAKRLEPDMAIELADKIKAGATDQELVEFIGAGLYSLGLAFRYLKTIDLLPQHMRNPWIRKRKKPKKPADKLLISCLQRGL